MRITFFNDLGQSYTIEIDPQMELENISALLEAESGIPVPEQSIYFEGRELTDANATISECGVRDGSVLLLRRKVTVAGRTADQDSEMMRLQILGDPNLMAQLRERQPELAEAVTGDPARFAELLRLTRQRHEEAEFARQQQIETLNADPFDVEAQRRIEEAIRQEAVMENLEHAIEFSPENFGQVHMLYIPVEVNGHPIKAFVDSGAQQTIMSPDCAEACGVMRLVDRRFSGIAKGVGTAQILGRVHSAQMKVADLFLACAFTIMEGKDVDLLFGLDMLKAHQACIDLEKNVLRIQGREVRFLAEHELPDKARRIHDTLEDAGLAPPPVASPRQGDSSFSAPGPSTPSRGAPTSFSGAGRTLGAMPSPRQAPTSRAPTSRFPQTAIATLVNLGASREEAVRVLEATNGDVDMAASLLF